MESILVPKLLGMIMCALLYMGMQAQDIQNVCDVNRKCSCCASQESCLASNLVFNEWSEFFDNGTCLGQCHTYNCPSHLCHEGYCRIPCKDGYWGGKCIQKCPMNCISCNQNFRKTYECFECVLGKYGKNCSKSCHVNCSNRTCNKTTGMCLFCNPGKYGTHCSEICPANCANNTCEKINGSCLSCKSEYYGINCSEKCPDNCDNDVCEKTTGTCVNCKQGYYGISCSESCPGKCATDICEKTNGTCLSCKNGYYGYRCSEKCPAYCHQNCDIISGYCDRCVGGYHGNKCDMTCSSNCATRVCLQGNGHCVDGCKSGFEGDLCESCTPGKYGEECSQSCSPGCKNNVCDKNLGKCTFECKDRFTDSKFCCANNSYCVTCASPSTCKMCMNSTYGIKCELQCPDKCNGTCDMRTGKCISCSAGYYGDECNMACNSLCRYNICDIDGGLCTFGCSNNSTAIDCVEEQIKQPELNSEVKSKKEFPLATVVGTVVSVLALLAISVTVFIVRRGYQNRSDGAMSSSKEDWATDDVCQNNEQEILGYRNVNSDDQGNIDGLYYEDVAEVHEENKNKEPVTNPYHNTRRSVRLDKIQELISKPHEAFQNEFKMLPRGLIKPHNDACKPENMKKNRYNAVYPYDENRVKVVCGHFDYINASYIKGFEKSRAYIAALGPTQKTIGDFVVFWKMVWQENVEVMVMLTRLVESSGMKCDQYWPDNGTVIKYGDISVQCDCEDVYAEFTARQFTMTLKKQRRQLHHVQFTAWPDKGVPDDIISIINLRQRIDRIGCRFDGPLLVHCSAGIGRTGTYIALDILSKQGAAEKAVDVFKCVWNLRQQRVNMVQILDQYKFLHYAVAWTFMVDIEQLPASSFQELSWVDRKLSDIYEMLQLDIFQETDEDNAAVVSNMGKIYSNRDNSDIPDNRHTVTIWSEGQAAAEATGYINAVFINGFRRRNRFIAAQTPLPGTVSDFLNMIIQYKPSCIIDIEPVADSQLDVGKYLPAANQCFQEGSHLFRVIGRDKQTNYTKRTLKISTNAQQNSVIRSVEHFTFTKWPEQTALPEDATHIVDLIRDIETALANTENEGPILIHCLNGAVRSGLLCGVWLAIERLEHEQRVNILSTLRQVKCRRRQTIVNKEQLKFCFECVSAYVNRFESHIYSNQ